jgi:hypothetical protein
MLLFAPDIFSFDNMTGANGCKKVHLAPGKGGGGVIVGWELVNSKQ